MAVREQLYTIDGQKYRIVSGTARELDMTHFDNVRPSDRIHLLDEMGDDGKWEANGFFLRKRDAEAAIGWS